MPTTGNELGDIVGDHIESNDANLQQTPNSLNQIDDFEQWSQDMQSNPVEVNYDELTDEIAEIVDKPKIMIADYLADTYFAPIYLLLKNNELPADDEKARKILLMSENYYIENDLLYKEQRVRSQYYQFCLLYTSDAADE